MWELNPVKMKVSLMTHPDQPVPTEPGTPVDDDRRKFLAACSKFAVITPPALTVMLSTSLSSKAIASSSGSEKPHPGHGGRDDDFLLWLEKWLDKLF
jgi:hypothetical protein